MVMGVFAVDFLATYRERVNKAACKIDYGKFICL